MTVPPLSINPGDISKIHETVKSVSSVLETVNFITRLYSPAEEKLKKEILDLRKELAESNKASIDSVENKRLLSELQKKNELAFLLDKVSEAAKELLLGSSKLQEEFLSKELCDAFVMSVDIRRSTELMLRARDLNLFAEFLSSLSTKMKDIITVQNLRNFGT